MKRLTSIILATAVTVAALGANAALAQPTNGIRRDRDMTITTVVLVTEQTITGARATGFMATGTAWTGVATTCGGHRGAMNGCMMAASSC